ncbi:MAG TPA: replicative DNA helicase [Pirellulales bacterium]
MATAQADTRSTSGGARGDLFDRLPPQSLEAEKAVLGSILLDPLLCDDVVLIVRPQDFYAHAHQVLFTHLLAMHEAGSRIDPMLLVERLKKAGDFEAIGGIAYLGEISQAVPTAANAVYYAQVVRDKATLRALIHTSTEILRDAYDQSREPHELLSSAEEQVFRILEDGTSADIISMEDALGETLSRIDARLSHGGIPGCVETGFTELDAMTGGLNAGELIIIAGRPGMGKTALAANIAEHVALAQQMTLFVSLEMSRHELSERMLCSYARINSHKLRNGNLSRAEQDRLPDISSELSQAKLYIDDSPSRTMAQIAATARRLKRRKDLSLVIIDYLQLIEPDNNKDQRQEQVARIARRLKTLARELKVPVLCLAQLNRQAEASRDNIPRLNHLRESGAIEQDADVVLFVHREEYYVTDPEQKDKVAGKADIIIAKQRNGPTGTSHVSWRQEFTRFEHGASEFLDDAEQFRPF